MSAVPGNSDHLGISLQVRCYSGTPRPKSKRRVIWRYAQADFGAACDLLDSLDMSYIFAEQSVDTCWSRWKEAFLNIMHICIPKSVLPDRTSVPWITKSIVQAIRKRNYYYKKAKRNCNSSLEKYRHLRSKVVTMLRNSKRVFFQNLNRSSSKSFWKAVKQLNPNRPAIPTLSVGDSTVISDKDKAEALNAHFTRCFNYSVPALKEARFITEDEPSTYLLCQEDEVRHMLSSIDVAKASGPDGIGARMLKSTAASIAPAVTNLFNLSLRLGRVPSEWKSARVTPVPKSSKFSYPANYRPVSLLSILSKLLEKHVQTLLLDHLESHSPILDEQWGFTKGKSTTGALLTATNNWHKSLEEGMDVCAVFLDLSKAFDKVPHGPLMDKLASLDIDPYLLNWLGDYLLQRDQHVVVNGESSVATKVVSGVPQGSVLGPLLFLIYIDGITEVPLAGSCRLIYADDILVYCQIRHARDYLIMQDVLDRLEVWLTQQYLLLNALKCKFMLISRRHTPIYLSNQLKISSVPLEQVPSFKYLGVWRTEKLSWSKHIIIDHITKKASKLVGLLYRRFSAHTPPEALLKLYLSFIRPHLEYAAPVWDPYCSSHVDVLERVQKFALRMCFKNWNLEYQQLLVASKLQSLAVRRKYLKLCYLFQVLNGTFRFPDLPTSRSPIDSRLRSADPAQLHLQPIFARTRSYQQSFFPKTITLWNSIPAGIQRSTSIVEFKHKISVYL